MRRTLLNRAISSKKLPLLTGFVQTFGATHSSPTVTFTVTREADTVYTLVENIPVYCIFGGNGPCNEWVFEDGIYKRTSGGAPVEPGQYTVNVEVSLDGENTNWRVDFTVALP